MQIKEDMNRWIRMEIQQLHQHQSRVEKKLKRLEDTKEATSKLLGLQSKDIIFWLFRVEKKRNITWLELHLKLRSTKPTEVEDERNQIHHKWIFFSHAFSLLLSPSINHEIHVLCIFLCVHSLVPHPLYWTNKWKMKEKRRLQSHSLCTLVKQLIPFTDHNLGWNNWNGREVRARDERKKWNKVK